ncbi:WD40 repeat-like protein [Xylaria arbuscula]|nr:WD40 repeat-like protein [Xylaria arbuscula]
MFLPFEPDIKEARIMTFGYNSHFGPGHGRSKMSILDFAKDLLYDMKYAIDETPMSSNENLHLGERPIIFVAHSMGGLIVKEAYMQGQNDPAYANIIKAISSIIFLSTPHRGTNLAETLNRILRVSFVSNPMQFIAELSAGSQTLQKLNEQFRHIAPRLQVISFYETRPTSMVKTSVMVLEKDSSVLGYPGEVSKPLDGDHHDVCKFDSPDDPRYIAVRNVLRSLVGETERPSNQDEGPKTGPAVQLNLEDYLFINETPDSDYNFFCDRWVPGTCEWILTQDAFSGWLEDIHNKPRVLWIHGNAASGKSILSSFIINHLVHHELPCHYFFIRFLDQKKRMISTVLRSLACQLAKTFPDYARSLSQLETAIIDLKNADYRTVWQWLFKQTLFQLTIKDPVFLIIDGVDEADSPGSIVRLLTELSLTSIPLRILLVSRKTHDISSAFQKLGKQVHVETIRTEGNPSDFSSYIRHEMDLAGDESYLEEVSRKLLDRAKGNFLWLHLAVQKINTCYTRQDVEGAMDHLPSGMEALYDRMSFSVQSQEKESDRRLGRDILGWTCCAQRPLKIEELTDALANKGVLEIHRTIGDLCGGFVTVDNEGKVAMVHETAREYLIRTGDAERPFTIDQNSINYQLLRTCIARLTDPMLRSQINRNQESALLDYASEAWFIHFARPSTAGTGVLEAAVTLLRSPHVLTWIYVIAKRRNLQVLAVASRYMTDVVLRMRAVSIDETLTRHRAIDVVEGWAIDLIKIVGKFGNSLIQYPDSIYKLIPPFCPETSAIYQQFGRKESRALHVSGSKTNTWDDCLARFILEKGAIASSVIAAGNHVAVLANVRKTGYVIIYQAATFEEQRRVTHPERVLKIQFNKLGTLLVSYGYITTRVWDMTTGKCIKTVRNPPKRPRPQTLQFLSDNITVRVGSEDRCVRSFQLTSVDEEWSTDLHIDEQTLVNSTVNFPVCSALSPDGNMIALGYRGHPATCWELEPPMLLGQCSIQLGSADMTNQYSTWGEVFQLAWHPLAVEVIGLDQVGLLFKWDPYDDESNLKFNARADCFTLSQDGSLTATGDALGTVKILATADFSLLYQLSSQDPISYLSFSTDSRRLYDTRGAYGNVWEPNTLVRLADSSEYPDHNSDMYSETTSLAKFSLNIEHHSARVDSVITLASQTVGPLYCYGTEDGVAILGEVGSGPVCELERLKSYMSIEHVAWSDDGRLVGLVDLAGKLTIKRVTKAANNRDSWEVQQEFDLMIPLSNGHITQLIFHPLGGELLATTPTRLFSVNLVTRALKEALLPPSFGDVRWLCHPKTVDYLLGFGTTSVRVVDWATLLEIGIFMFSPPRSQPSPTGRSEPSFKDPGGAYKHVEKIGRVFSNVDSSHVLLQISRSISSQTDTQYLVFDTSALDLTSKTDDKDVGERNISYILVPQDIASRIREPLAFLSHRRLVFLDIDRWICTWRLPSPQRFGDFGAGRAAIEQFYFLPGDWVTANEVHLYSIMPDGTLLCPRNGDVATVQSAKLRK